MARLLNGVYVFMKHQLRNDDQHQRRGGIMKAPFFGVTAGIGIIAVALFFLSPVEGQPVRSPAQENPYHLYKLQYSYNGNIWHDLIIIENGTLSETIHYLRRGEKVPQLRCWYSYLDDEGVKRVVYIPLTMGGNT